MLGVNASPDIQVVPSSSSSKLSSKGKETSGSAVPTKQASVNPLVSQAINHASSQSVTPRSGASTEVTSADSTNQAPLSSHLSINHNAALKSTESLNLPSHLSSSTSPTNGVNASSLMKGSTGGEPVTFSLNLGPLTVSGLVNTAPSRTTSGAELGLGLDNPQNPFFQEPFDNANQQNGFDSQTQTAIKGQGDVKPDNPAKEAKQTEDEPPVIFTHNLNPVDEGDDQDSEAQAAIEKQILAELSSRDSEVKAHEQAHSTVGGHLAQSPQFTYEQGSDGRRYAVDGEVQIDIATVPGDPLATVNKMKQVYAAAMAPTNPSMADIRVASEALKKMNEAKAQLVEQRQEKALTPSEMAPLIGAENAINGVVFPEPHRPIVSGEVKENGSISPHLVDSPSAIDDIDQLTPTVEQINKQLQHTVPTDKPVLSTVSLSFSPEVIAQRYSA
ncbi:putative metalloprotease CJM1_0395 family protein [Shewanella sp. UCD-KL12]|uniref:putative metalloprotease CJM1_0395 family protein n=1 Tax=Shewanella sp. UCD-KL12 TaxID=1917163 RepID=UPI0009706B0B|nr:putative metalloprotease CJM1_0395 family protein [Shewanella sp. UCD-KL12]